MNRVELDRLIQFAAKLKTSAETTLAWRNLQMAKAWAGEYLAYTALSPSPYEVVGDVKKIPPTDSVFKGEIEITDRLTAINEIRAEIEEMKKLVSEEMGEMIGSNCIFQVLVHLTEAKFWFGFELANMREAAESNRSSPA